jgi:hypothetical protein
MKNHGYKVKIVEVNYNGDSEKFDKFVQSVVRDYVSEDATEPDEEEDETFSMTIA